METCQQKHNTLVLYLSGKLLSMQGVPGGKINVLGGHSIGHSKQKTLYEHVSYSERFPRYSHLTLQ